MVISGGHYKADSLKWRDKLIRLVRASGLNMEDQDIDLGPVFCGLYNGDATFRRWMVAKEERRRLFWLIYCLDRHLALSFNMRISIAEGTFCVRTPLPEKLWQTLDTADLNSIPTNELGPPSQISGTGFFEYFLPLARVLGHIIDLHHFKAHPTIGHFIPHEAIHRIETMIAQREQEVADLENQTDTSLPNDVAARPFPRSSDGGVAPGVETFGSPSASMTKDSKVQLVKIYSTYLLHVFYILLHGKWDPISMIEDRDDWITSESFVTCASHALSASAVVSQILTIDPEMTFMPYLFGIYLLQGSFILLLFVDRMPELGPNRSVEEVCETIIRAHEVSVVTLDTTFQVSVYGALWFSIYCVEWKRQRANPLIRKTFARCFGPCCTTPSRLDHILGMSIRRVGENYCLYIDGHRWPKGLHINFSFSFLLYNIPPTMSQVTGRTTHMIPNLEQSNHLMCNNLFERYEVNCTLFLIQQE